MVGRARHTTIRGAKALIIALMRTIVGSFRRFLSLAAITALGITMLLGLRMACIDLRMSADRYFDDQKVFDLRVQSTLGLTHEDIDALAGINGVETAEGGWARTAYTQVGASRARVLVRTVSDSGLNAPRLLEGRLPQAAGEVAVTKRYLEESGHALGDAVNFKEGGSESEVDDASDQQTFAPGSYTIVGCVLDPFDVNAGKGTMSFRGGGGPQHTFFVSPASVQDTLLFTVAYVRVAGAADMLCYSSEYEHAIDLVRQNIESVRQSCEQARGDAVRSEAGKRVDDAEAQANTEITDAKDKLDAADAEVVSGQAQTDAARRRLRDEEARANSKLGDAGQTLADSESRMAEAEQTLQQGESDYANGRSQLAAQLGCDSSAIESTLAAREQELASAVNSLEQAGAGAAQLIGPSWPASAWERLIHAGSTAEAQAAGAEVDAVLTPFCREATQGLSALISWLQSPEVQGLSASNTWTPATRQRAYELAGAVPGTAGQLLAGTVEQGPAALMVTAQQLLPQVAGLQHVVGQAQGVAAGREGLAAAQQGVARLAQSRTQLDAGWSSLEQARHELAAGRARLSQETASALAAIASGRRQVEDGQAEVDKGREQVEEGRRQLEDQEQQAADKIDQARKDVAALPNATWYVQDRSSLPSHASIESDASSIEVLGAVLPIVFLVVSVLVSLTTMTRMVDEERGLVGLLKALGYGKSSVLGRYAAYSLSACLVGGVIGHLGGLIGIPAIIFTIFSTMYSLPGYGFAADPLWSGAALALFAAAVTGSALLVCAHLLRETPASLMHPKPPRAGARIFLEYIPPLWRRMTFLDKVTARNILRYRRRFLMTVLGIAGCTALLIMGLGIRDTVPSLSERQYGAGGVVGYDLMVVANPADVSGIRSDLYAQGELGSDVSIYTDSATVMLGEKRGSVQLIVVPDGTSLEGMLNLRSKNGEELNFTNGHHAILTVNAANLLGADTGSAISLEDSALAKGDVSIDGVAVAYLGNLLVLDQSAYEQALGKTYEADAFLAQLTGDKNEQVELSERLALDDRVLSVTSTQALVDGFSTSFALINTVVYVVVALAASLSIVVVFTLTSINLAERERELATIKVLGFRRREVRRYIGRETLVLTGFGAALGVPLGYGLARSLTYALQMPALYFDVVVSPWSYVIAVVLAYAFTLVVSAIVNRQADHVDMVGALKAVE